MIDVKINTEIIKLDAFLKWSGAVSMGSDAKMYILSGAVKVNGSIEEKRGRKLKKGDIVELDSESYKII
ncbi:RNA-binding S4 domain-containing protein [Clostridium sp. MB40-C1]|uniref:RNA-binding S4 domain-containing protein n=1 Tax=Clostridium sp. MB40-C1 TaxID=3070996 RepID=UPI0027E19DAB|nr:RNA-binding S4 domain-containing protein [Clostridium sp. MB40-C1]WMJ80071.1 RNA-binding S4 domain-containing protein [Clostridium sp. MB40-C1]